MLIEKIKSYVPKNRQEMQDKKVMLDYWKLFESQLLTRENEFAHFTSSAFVVNESKDKVLMVYHNIYNSWAWTGGHADGEADLFAVALNEAIEETGIEHISPLTEDIMSLEILPVVGHLKRGEYVSAHQHLNLSYVFIASETDNLRIKEDENSKVGWIPLNKITDYVKEEHMIPIYEKLIQQIVAV